MYLATFLCANKKMPEPHAFSKFLYWFCALPTPVSPRRGKVRMGVMAQAQPLKFQKPTPVSPRRGKVRMGVRPLSPPPCVEAGLMPFAPTAFRCSKMNYDPETWEGER